MAALGRVKCVASCNFPLRSGEIPRSTPGGETIQASWERSRSIGFRSFAAAGPMSVNYCMMAIQHACVGDAAFAYVNAFKAHVNVGFFCGTELHDPAGLLEGTGKFMRHVKLRPESAVNTAALEQLIEAAYKDTKAHFNAGHGAV